MKDTYGDVEHWATATTMRIKGDKPYPIDGYLLTSIVVHSDFRKNGYGTALLKRVLADADAEGVTMYLTVDPSLEDNNMSRRRLTAWYKSYGFYKMPQRFGSHLMIRDPKRGRYR